MTRFSRRHPAALLFSGGAALVLGWAALATFAAPPPADASKPQRKVDILADTYSEKQTSAGTILTLAHNVRLKSEDSTLLTDLAMLNNTTKIADSPGKLKIDDAQNTIIGNKGVAYYKTRDAKVSGAVQITVRPKPNDSGASEGSARREFKSPVTINCDNVDYNWKRKVAIATGHLIFYYEDRTVTADRATYFGDDERVILEGHVHYTRKNGDHGDSDAADAVLKEGAEEYHIPKGKKQINALITLDDEESDQDKKPDKASTPATKPPTGPVPVLPSSPASPTNNVAPPVTPTIPTTAPTTTPGTDPATTPVTTPPTGTGNPASGPATPTKP